MRTLTLTMRGMGEGMTRKIWMVSLLPSMLPKSHGSPGALIVKDAWAQSQLRASPGAANSRRVVVLRLTASIKKINVM